jgi:diguanylate cyclase (GGDEF)-like protein/PAS domain S-box-containing protein
MTTKSFTLLILILLLITQPTFALDGAAQIQTDKVRLQLKWFHQFQFAGYYAAKQRGFYAEEGLDVEIVERDPQQDVLQQVVAGQAEYGVGDSGILAHYANGQPVVALAAIFQHSALALFSKRSSAITEPNDLVGKRIMLDTVGERFSSLRVLFAKADLDASRYTAIGQGLAIEDLLNGKVDVVAGYASDMPYEFQKRGIAFNVINPQNYGIDFYGDLLFTSRQELLSHPGRAERFRRASLKGWQYALEHDEELVKLIRLQYLSKKPMKSLRFEAAEMRKLITPDLVTLGDLDIGRLQDIAGHYQSLQLAPAMAESQLQQFIFSNSPHSVPESIPNIANDAVSKPRVEMTTFSALNLEPWAQYGGYVLALLALFGYWIYRLKREVRARRRSESELALLYTNMSLGFALHRVVRDESAVIIDYRYLEINPAFERMTGIRRSHCLGKTARQMQPNSKPRWIRHFAEVEASGKPKHFESHAKGTSRYYITNCYQAGRDCFVVLLHDISERKRAEEKLQLSARVFSDAHEGIIITDINGSIIDVNAAFTTITGYSREEVLGENPSKLNSGRQSAEFYKNMWQSVHNDGHWQGEVWNRNKAGDLYAELLTISALRDKKNQVINYIGLFSDITESKKQQQALELLAHYDPLTQLPNRALFADRFNQAIAYSKRTEEQLAVCYLDLDGFKQVNDNYGHEVGDELLIEVAKRIKLKLRESDSVCRLGGDEFVVLLENLQSPQQCEETLKRIHAALAEPFPLAGKEIRISASSGVTIYPLDKDEPDILLRHADQAMYKAKQAGRNCYRFHLYSPISQLLGHNPQFSRFQDGTDEIQKALLSDQFCLYYQPKVNLKTGEVFGVEALIRWRHPQRGLLQPKDFLPLVEATTLEIDISNWLVRQAFQQVQDWLNLGLKMQISINVSPRFLQWQNFLVMLDSVLADYPAVSSRQIELEVLESSVLDDMGPVAEVLRQCFYQFGVSCALDDFGTGYSSLTHLRHLTINTVKIDQTFVGNMIANPDDQSIVESVIGLAKAFKREVIAEGVETLDDGIFLINLGCSLAQGNVIAKPMPAEEVVEWVKSYSNPPVWQQQADSRRNTLQRQLLLLRIQQQHWLQRIQEIQQAPSNGNLSWPILIPKKTHLGKWLLRSQLNKTIDPLPLQQLQQSLAQQCKLAMLLRQQHREGSKEAATTVFARLWQANERTGRLLQQLEQEAAS